MSPLFFVLLVAPLLGPQVARTGEGAAAVARAVEERYHSAQTLSAVFLERYSENGKQVRVESGKVFFARGGRMRWEYETPEVKLFLADGRLVWFYVPADRTVMRSKFKESDDWRTPLALLVGKARFSRFCSRIELVDNPAAPAGNRTLRCLPKGKDAAFSELLVEADASFRLARVVIREAAGVETEFRFGGWKENPPLAKDFFQFRVPPGVAIVEEPVMPGAVP